MTVEQPSQSGPVTVGLIVGAVLTLGVIARVHGAVADAKERLLTPEINKPAVAIADQSEVGYCTPRFKEVLQWAYKHYDRVLIDCPPVMGIADSAILGSAADGVLFIEVLQRVLHSCGLVSGEGGRRGCQPADVKTFASISDTDFNELFTPLKQRGAVVMYDEGKDDLDERAKKVLEDMWFERKGARYFFVVARASKTGTVDKNRALSHRRANSVMFHLKDVSKDPEIEKIVGLLWLGNEFAQLSKDYCGWNSSRPDTKCNEEAINRSAFVSWVDCRL